MLAPQLVGLDPQQEELQVQGLVRENSLGLVLQGEFRELVLQLVLVQGYLLREELIRWEEWRKLRVRGKGVWE